MAKLGWKAAVTGVAAIGAASGGYAALVRPRLLRWGATPEEDGREWPGDSLTPDARFISTRAVTVDAPASVVWRQPKRRAPSMS